jgi:hypothetical protein
MRVWRRQNRRRPNLRKPRTFRDRSNPLETLSEEEVFVRYRFRPHTIIYIMTLLPDLTTSTNRNCPIPPLLQLLVTLRFLATGAIHLLVADSVNISRASANRIIRNITLFLSRLCPQFIKFPRGVSANETKSGFAKIAGLYCIH